MKKDFTPSEKRIIRKAQKAATGYRERAIIANAIRIEEFCINADHECYSIIRSECGTENACVFDMKTGKFVG